MIFLAHGGTPGLIGELSVGLAVVGLVAYVWVRERRRRARGERPARAEMRDEE